MGAEGDFALAYVIAHEVGHHIQTLVGTADQVRQMQARSGQVESNQLQVRMELQATALPVFGRTTLNNKGTSWSPATSKKAFGRPLPSATTIFNAWRGRRVVPEAFTHGSSEQRMTWLKRGLQAAIFRPATLFKLNRLRRKDRDGRHEQHFCLLRRRHDRLSIDRGSFYQRRQAEMGPWSGA